MSRFGTFVPYEELVIEKKFYDKKLKQERKKKEVYKLRLPRYWKIKLEQSYGIDIIRYYADMCTTGSIGNEYKFGAVLWALLNGGGQNFTEEEACNFIDYAVKYAGYDALAFAVHSALTGALMTDEQYKKYKELTRYMNENEPPEILEVEEKK
ncbi:hypothetical protein CLPU_3c00790 [Gottschalkia purinilytica]|uniref:Uncharacterized protein n=1 Tax=Gottschalkia purinilytica TaxID=1503 RepID=A0A0L0WCX8_GOTPU|nr:hypothetical protein [Gottschalkia purinilytica]KNF09301.1 hypothetical protein CLPU_3c00790 [Gottschalkia purinilytica]